MVFGRPFHSSHKRRDIFACVSRPRNKPLIDSQNVGPWILDGWNYLISNETPLQLLLRWWQYRQQCWKYHVRGFAVLGPVMLLRIRVTVTSSSFGLSVFITEASEVGSFAMKKPLGSSIPDPSLQSFLSSSFFWYGNVTSSFHEVPHKRQLLMLL